MDLLTVIFGLLSIAWMGGMIWAGSIAFRNRKDKK